MAEAENAALVAAAAGAANAPAGGEDIGGMERMQLVLVMEQEQHNKLGSGAGGV